ncbi:hypothetical protein BGX21_005908, partial [Mortierella sp. AD011]
MFAWQSNEEEELHLPGVTLKPVEMSYDIVKFDLDLSLSEADGEIVGGLNYSTALFDRPTIERHVGYLQAMLQAMVDDSTQSIGAVDILSPSERQLLLETWNATSTPYPDDLCIHQYFERQVTESPDTIAIVFDDQQMSYGELNARANSLAHHLISLGVKPDTLIAICVDRSLAMVIGLLAILKAGGAYVPLDPSFASDRLQDIFTDVAPSILVADYVGVAALGASISESTAIIDPNILLNMSSENPHVPGLSSKHLSYVLYTSGSTGRPKGVMIEHQGVTNLAMSRLSILGVGPSCKVLQLFSFSFDGSVHEIWSALSFGGSLHIVNNVMRQDISQLWAYIEQRSITHAALTPSILQDHKNLTSLSNPLTLVIAGEALPLTLLKALRKLIPQASIMNDYGPTETTVAAATWKCPADFNGDITPIGRPIPNKKIYVLDSQRNLTPLGATGELYIGGAGIARGYINRPDLTDEAFLTDFFVPSGQSRMYKTGDLVRYLPDGNLVFLGRNDHQVKIRGFRIELGEIEARLVEHLLVHEVAVVALGADDDKRLVAYVVADDSDHLAQLLHDHLTPILPDYMIPAAF